MTRREGMLAAIGAALLAVGAWFVSGAHGGMRYFVLNAGSECPSVPVVMLEPSAPPLNGSIVAIHGLGANRVVMLTLGQRLAAAGFRVYLFDGPGHGNNTTPFSFARSTGCAAAVVSTLSKEGKIDLRRTVLLGHSLGGGIALLVSHRFDVAGTIAAAPAPEPLPPGIPANLLMLSPQLDVPAIHRMEQTVRERAGGRTDSPADFAARRAFREMELKGRTHTGVVFDPVATRETARWAAAALGASLPANYRMPWGGFLGGLLGLAGLALSFPLAATGAAKAWRVLPVAGQASGAHPLHAVVYWTPSALLGVGVLTIWAPFQGLHLYSGDYLVSLAAIASVPLLILLAPQWRAAGKATKNALGMAGTLGFATFLAFGGWLDWQLTDAWMNLARWERFPFVACIIFPYCLAEELALGFPAGLKFGPRAGRLAMYLVLRFIVWTAAAYAVIVGLSGALLVVFLFVYLVLFSIGQRLAVDAVRRRTGSALAAAIFSAILGAWFVAATFPLG